MSIAETNIIASCALNKAGDKNNMCFLSSDALYIRYKGKTTSYGLSEVKGIALKKKLFLFPVVCGGILTPLSVVALYGLDAAPWVTLGLMGAGLLLLYYGWEGSFSLSVETQVKEYDFFVPKVTEEINTFVKKVVSHKGTAY